MAMEPTAQELIALVQRCKTTSSDWGPVGLTMLRLAMNEVEELIAAERIDDDKAFAMLAGAMARIDQLLTDPALQGFWITVGGERMIAQQDMPIIEALLKPL